MWCVVWVRDLYIFFFPRRLPVDSSWLHPARPCSPLICTLSLSHVDFSCVWIHLCVLPNMFTDLPRKHSLTVSLLKNISLSLSYSHFCVSFRNNLSNIKQLSWDLIGIAEKCNINLKRNFAMIPSPYYYCACQESSTTCLMDIFVYFYLVFL